MRCKYGAASERERMSRFPQPAAHRRADESKWGASPMEPVAKRRRLRFELPALLEE
jgi:hypothetical protein